MKRIRFLSFLMLAVLALPLQAQTDVTTFLGIPVDGYKNEMKQKLIAKGFEEQKVDDIEFLTGEFNGADVNIHIVTHNNKVWRLMLVDKVYRDEEEIKRRFNNLVRQFEKNERYRYYNDYRIDDDVDIVRQIQIKKKRFEAIYHQKPNQETKDKIYEDIKLRMAAAEHAIPNDSIIIYKNALYEIETYEASQPKSVWFYIDKMELFDKFRIIMYYDNELNKADGEDL